MALRCCLHPFAFHFEFSHSLPVIVYNFCVFVGVVVVVAAASCFHFWPYGVRVCV